MLMAAKRGGRVPLARLVSAAVDGVTDQLAGEPRGRGVELEPDRARVWHGHLNMELVGATCRAVEPRPLVRVRVRVRG